MSRLKKYFTQCTQHAQLASLLGATGWGTNLGNLLQGGEAYVKVFADFSPFPATVCLLVAQRPKQKRNDMTTKSTLIKSILMHFLILFWGYRSICLKSITLEARESDTVCFGVGNCH